MISLRSKKHGVLRFLKCLTVLTLGATSSHVYAQDSSSVVWHENYQEALKESSEKKLPLLLFFSGSDWNGLCMKIRKEVLDSGSFAEKVKDKFVCVGVDFPKHVTQEKCVSQQNKHLKSQFSVRGFPCLLLLSSDEREVFRISSFGSISGSALADHLCYIVESDATLRRVFPQLASLSMEDLVTYYQLAEELSRRDFMASALEYGVKGEHPFFLTEKFRLLVSAGKMDSLECQNIKERLLQQDPDNAQTHFTVALIEFQELAKRAREGAHQEVSQVVAPLEKYLQLFGQSNQENKWRVEMMIAQFYLESDQWSNALKHAEVAFENAPTEMRAPISRSLDYIRHQS